MEEIPLPASPDSPGPPGEEHVEREMFQKRPSRRKSPDNIVQDDAKRQTYSPTMETSSPEYETEKDHSK